MPKLSRVSFFLFVFFYNYLWLRIVVFNFLYKSYGTSGFIIGIIMLFIIGILLALIVKLVKKRNINELLNKSIVKWIFIFLSLLEMVFLISYVSKYLNSLFINSSNVYILISILSLVIIYVSNMKEKEVIDISTLFNIFGIILILISFTIVPKMEIEYLFIQKDGSRIGLFLMSGFVVLDNVKLLFQNNETDKKNIILPSLAGFALVIIEYGLLVMVVGDKVFIDIDYVGLLKLSFMPVTKYFGDFNFVYIYLLMVCLIFRCGYNLSIVKENTNIDIRLLNIVIYLAIVGCSIVCLLNISIDNTLYKYVIGVEYLFLVIVLWMGWINNVRKIKE